jgi:hypothetical protein
MRDLALSLNVPRSPNRRAVAPIDSDRVRIRPTGGHGRGPPTGSERGARRVALAIGRPTVDLAAATEPRTLADLDLATLPGELAVAENAAA